MTILNGALPAFAPDGGIPLALVRGLVSAGLFSGFGGALFGSVLLPRDAGAAPRRAVRRLTLGGLLLSGIALLAWLLLEAHSMSDAADLGDTLSALPAVVRATSFGHLVCLQLLCLAIAAARARFRLPASLAALLLQAGHSHAFAMTPGISLLLVSDCLHLLAGGAWLGGLLPLLFTLRHATPSQAAAASRRFSPLGRVCVATIAATALFQGWILIGSIPALLGTAYGWMALVKLALFVLLIAFACANQFRFTPGLRGPHPQRPQRALFVSVAAEALIGLAVLLAAGLLADLPPGMHDQPVWPFSQQFSTVTIDEDPSFRREAILALAALAVALVLLLTTPLLWKSARALKGGSLLNWGRIAAAFVIAGLALPHLDLLLIEAYPTSFYHSPTHFAADTIMQGAALYPTHCAACHGPTGHGDGPAARSLLVPPADLTAPHLWMHSDGEIFWWLTHGIEAPLGGMAMPGFARQLTPEQRWSLIDFIRANNAGQARRAGDASQPVQAPGFSATCDGLETTRAALRGRAVRLASHPTPPLPGFVSCTTDDDTVLAAYTLVSGHPGAAQFLIDAQGWLRAAAPFDPQQQRDAMTPLPANGAAPAMKMDMPM